MIENMYCIYNEEDKRLGEQNDMNQRYKFCKMYFLPRFMTPHE